MVTTGSQIVLANVRSIRWKKITPAESSTRTPAVLMVSCDGEGAAVSSQAQRKPSITPAIGLSPYSQRQRSGINSTEYATGEANIQMCSRNGKRVARHGT